MVTPRRIAQLGLFTLTGLLATLAFGQPNKPTAGERHALLVGVNAYSPASGLRRLEYPEKDVNALANVLRADRYKNVRVLSQRGDDNDQPLKKNIDKELVAILKDRNPGDTVLIMFAGHGVQFKKTADEAWFCPMDANLDDTSTLVSMKKTYDQLKACRADCKVLLSDACRNDPVEGRRNAGKVESVTRPQRIPPPGGVAVFFSCSAGQEALERKDLGHGLFTHFLLEGFKEGKIELFDVGKFVATEVDKYVTENKLPMQTPELISEVRLKLPLLASAPAKKAAPVAKRPAEDPPAGDPGKATPARGDGKEITIVGMKLVRIESGKFLMGSHSNEEEHRPDEAQHLVTITKPFYLGIHEVTQDQYEKVMGANPSGFQGDGRRPVECVSWDDAQKFCAKLSQMDNKRTYRLPTEAEWEYACRAGTKAPCCYGASLNSTQANFNGQYPYGGAAKNKFVQKTTPVGSYKANAWGLFDMHGNVHEWCQDYYDVSYYGSSPPADPPGPKSGKQRVKRGGGWWFSGGNCRSAYRGSDLTKNDPNVEDEKSVHVGFRVAATAR